MNKLTPEEEKEFYKLCNNIEFLSGFPVRIPIKFAKKLKDFIATIKHNAVEEGQNNAVDYIWERTKEVGTIKGEDIKFHSDQLSAIFENARKSNTKKND